MWNNTPVELAEMDNPTLIAEEEALDHEVVIQSKVLMAKRQVPKQVSTEYWIKLQKRDAVIGHVRGWMLRSPADKRTLSQYLLGKVPDDIRQAYAPLSEGPGHVSQLFLHESDHPQCQRCYPGICGPGYQKMSSNRWMSS